MSIGITLGTGLAIAGGLGAAGGIASGIIGSHAATTAAGEQVSAEQQALQQEESNISPYLSLGNTSIGNLMTAFQNGTFGPGSLPAFTAPTLTDAQNNPGFEFEAQQGNKGLAEVAAAAGGAVSGGTLRAASTFNQGLASTNYQQVFNNALSGYQANLGKQAQEFGETFTPVQLGANAAAGQNTNIGNIMANIGNSQAAGTIGSASSLASGIASAANTPGNLLQSFLYGNLFKNAGTSASVAPGTGSFNAVPNPANFGVGLNLGIGPG